jgi:4-amino-4-deoxy-L-arabinose transferase-like glycosyltransferase
VLLDIGWREYRKGQVALHTIVLVLMLVGAGLGIATKGWQSVGLPVLLIVQ